MLIVTAGKGGAGKTTTAVTFAVMAYDSGKRVGFLDADNQNSASEWLQEAEPAITLRTVPWDLELKQKIRLIDRELKTLLAHHDVVFADAAGGFSDESLSLILQAQLLLIPFEANLLDLRTTAKAIDFLKKARRINNSRRYRQACLIVNKLDTRRTRTIAELDRLVPNLSEPVAETRIRFLNPLPEAVKQSTVVSRGKQRRWQGAATDFRRLYHEIAERFAPDLLSSERHGRAA